ncbi:MAG: hypothetical protein EAY75_08080 [Bacteroidetes bacterium]|nr:MAG: hypothetical protein EAY75_08080 [Bacteroidota bacterium]
MVCHFLQWGARHSGRGAAGFNGTSGANFRARTAVLDWPQQADGLSGLWAGILVGLFVGKPVGVFIAARLMVWAKLAVLPKGINWRHMWGAGMLAGIGFTMGIFMANLAFTVLAYQNAAKLAILLASLLAAVLGYAWLSWQAVGKQKRQPM